MYGYLTLTVYLYNSYFYICMETMYLYWQKPFASQKTKPFCGFNCFDKDT